MTEEKVHLNPCPFCGGDASDPYKKGNDWVISCRHCGTAVKDYFKDRVIQRWNTRIEYVGEPENPYRCFICGKTIDPSKLNTVYRLFGGCHGYTEPHVLCDKHTHYFLNHQHTESQFFFYDQVLCIKLLNIIDACEEPPIIDDVEAILGEKSLKVFNTVWFLINDGYVEHVDRGEGKSPGLKICEAMRGHWEDLEVKEGNAGYLVRRAVE